MSAYTPKNSSNLRQSISTSEFEATPMEDTTPKDESSPAMVDFTAVNRRLDKLRKILPRRPYLIRPRYGYDFRLTPEQERQWTKDCPFMSGEQQYLTYKPLRNDPILETIPIPWTMWSETGDLDPFVEPSKEAIEEEKRDRESRRASFSDTSTSVSSGASPRKKISMAEYTSRLRAKKEAAEAAKNGEVVKTTNGESSSNGVVDEQKTKGDSSSSNGVVEERKRNGDGSSNGVEEPKTNSGSSNGVVEEQKTKGDGMSNGVEEPKTNSGSSKGVVEEQKTKGDGMSNGTEEQKTNGHGSGDVVGEQKTTGHASIDVVGEQKTTTTKRPRSPSTDGKEDKERPAKRARSPSPAGSEDGEISERQRPSLSPVVPADHHPTTTTTTTTTKRPRSPSIDGSEDGEISAKRQKMSPAPEKKEGKEEAAAPKPAVEAPAFDLPPRMVSPLPPPVVAKLDEPELTWATWREQYSRLIELGRQLAARDMAERREGGGGGS
ncbi:MAG: suppressor of loss of ypt1 [Watsoniomyces obsoletus]|nr:MAG: suppressor of loss of ypt1 [Watsoniomyces obsoletus]